MREQSEEQAQGQAQGRGQDQEQGQDRNQDQDQDPGQNQDQNQEQPKALVFTSTLSLLLIGPALLLLRFLGEFTWIYWTAAVIGVTGAVIAVFEFVAAIRSLLRRRRMLASVWAAFLLAAGVFVLGLRLSGS